MGNSSKRDARAADRAEVQRKALELRKAGASYDQIARELTLSDRSQARNLVKGAIAEIIREPSEEVLQTELARLDTMLLGCWQKAKGGDLQAVDRALRIMERRAAYLGIDAPKSVHFDVSKLSNDQLRQILGGDAAAPASSGAGGAAEAAKSSPSPDDEGDGEGKG